MTDELSDAEIDAALFHARVPAIAMVRTPNQTDPGTPGCWFGGDPTLPPEIPWPYYQPTEQEAYVIRYEDPNLAIPMHFLVQINLAYCPRVLGLPILPRTGTIFVFYDPAVAQATDRIAFATGTGCNVIYVPEDVRHCPPRAAPPMPDLSSTEVSTDYHGTSSFVRWPFDFLVVDTYSVGDPPGAPRGIHHLLAARREELDEQREQALEDYRGPDAAQHRRGKPMGPHFIFGASRQEHFPSADWLLRAGIDYLPELTDEHMLLFCFPGDWGIGHQTGSQIALEFWIKHKNLTTGNFNNLAVWGA